MLEESNSDSSLFMMNINLNNNQKPSTLSYNSHPSSSSMGHHITQAKNLWNGIMQYEENHEDIKRIRPGSHSLQRGTEPLRDFIDSRSPSVDQQQLKVFVNQYLNFLYVQTKKFEIFMKRKLSSELVKETDRMKTKIQQSQPLMNKQTLDDDEPQGESIQEILLPPNLKSVSDRESDHMKDSIQSTKVLQTSKNNYIYNPLLVISNLKHKIDQKLKSNMESFRSSQISQSSMMKESLKKSEVSQISEQSIDINHPQSTTRQAPQNFQSSQSPSQSNSSKVSKDSTKNNQKQASESESSNSRELPAQPRKIQHSTTISLSNIINTFDQAAIKQLIQQWIQRAHFQRINVSSITAGHPHETSNLEQTNVLNHSYLRSPDTSYIMSVKPVSVDLSVPKNLKNKNENVEVMQVTKVKEQTIQLIFIDTVMEQKVGSFKVIGKNPFYQQQSIEVRFSTRNIKTLVVVESNQMLFKQGFKAFTNNKLLIQIK